MQFPTELAGYASRMAGPHFLKFALILSFAANVGFAQSKFSADSISITPAAVEAGSPVLIRVTKSKDETVSGEWLGHPIQFFPAQNADVRFALVGVDVEQAIGPSTLNISRTLGVSVVKFSRTVEIHPAHYRTGSLTVPPKFVEPGPEEQKQIAADTELKSKIFASSAPEPLWRGNFRAPVRAAPTDSFGTRRMFNGKLASIHKGMDFHAAEGTIVRASNTGVVVLALPLYYEGNCVIIDHGLGIYTLSMHFSRIDVHAGQHVSAGDKLGLSGATGRVTGPHLHWAVRWQGAYLDPAKLLRLNLNAVR
jgi:murein DD-endopeptidase MepM/ murein hydrolase activator NlpD